MGRIREEEDDADSGSQAEASSFLHHAAKRCALDPAFSQVCSSPDPVIHQPSSALYSAFSQASSAPRARSWRHGQWWSTEMGGPVQIGVDFVPDTQEGGGEEFIFFPDSSGCIHVVNDAKRAHERGRQKVEHLRQLFPPMPSMTDQLRDYVKSTGGKSEKLLELYGIKATTSERMEDHGSESPSSITWSSNPSPVLGTDPSLLHKHHLDHHQLDHLLRHVQ